MSRYYAFGAAILFGFLAAVYYGWAGRPVAARNADPTLLRADFRADYVLMVAEAYSVDHEIERAIGTLGFLSKEEKGYNPLTFVIEAMAFGAEEGYTNSDLELLQGLEEALKTFDPGFAATPTP